MGTKETKEIVAMGLKNIILTAWAACTNEHERGEVLDQIDAARREIRIQYLWAEPELRKALEALEAELTSVMRGRVHIARVPLFEHGDGSGPRHAPIVGLAGTVAMLLAVRANHEAEMQRELRGAVVHASRFEDAREARRHPARPMGPSFTGYVEPVDPLSVPCLICRAGIGTKCVQPAL